MALGRLRSFGLALASLKGFAWAISLVPTAVVIVTGVLDDLRRSQIVLYITAALVLGAMLSYFALRLIRESMGLFTARAERKRIDSMLREMEAGGIKESDIATLAGVWAGTLEAGNVVRHLRFRELKAAAIAGRIPIAKLNGGEVNQKSVIAISNLRYFLKSRGVID